MLIVWGYLILIVIAGSLLIIFGSFLLRLLRIGISLFFISEIVTTALAIFGVMDYKSTWPISKWAFYIGSAIGIMQFIRSPGSVLRDTADIVTGIGGGDNPKGKDEPKGDDGDGHGFPCCDNCRWNQDRGSYTVRCFQDSSRNKVANEKCGQWQHY